MKNVWSYRQTPIHTVVAWCFIRRQNRDPKEVAEITDRKTSKSQQENSVLLVAYAVFIYCAEETWNHASHTKLLRFNAFNSTAPRSGERFPSQLIVNKRVCFCLLLRWCNKKFLVSVLHSSAETSPPAALYVHYWLSVVSREHQRGLRTGLQAAGRLDVFKRLQRAATLQTRNECRCAVRRHIPYWVRKCNIKCTESQH